GRGGGGAGRVGGGTGPDTRGVGRLPDQRSITVAVVPGPAGRGLWAGRTGRGRAAGAARGAGGDADHGGTHVCGRSVSAQGRAVAATVCGAAGRSRGVFASGPHRRPSPAGEVVGAAGGDESEPPVAAAGQADRSTGTLGTNLQ